MSADRKMTRRSLLITSAGAGAATLGAVAAAAGVGGGLLPPDNGGPYGLGETLNYAAHRLLVGDAMAREFPRSAISPVPFANGQPPVDPAFVALQKDGFTGWKLAVEGLVAKPASFTLADLRQQPATSHITQLACEEGWTYIAEWTGVALSHVLRVMAGGIAPQARYVAYFSLQGDWWDSVDLDEALHPQTLVAFGLNGGDLPVGNGGPLRMRVPRQLGYKNVKYISRLVVTDSLKGFGKGLGSASPEAGYTWYAGI